MRIGRYAEGKGGIYAGVVRMEDGDYHLFVAEVGTKRDVIWKNAMAWAQGVSIDGHSDFALPTRKQAALLYANLQDGFEDRWWWTSELYPPDEKCAWVQTMGYGRQADARLTDACRACAVRVERVE